MRALLLVPLLLLAAPALAQEDEDVDILIETKADDAWVEARVREMLSGDPDRRAAAIEALTGTDPEKVVEVLQRVLEADAKPGGTDLRVVVTPHVKNARGGGGVIILDPLAGSSEVIRGSADDYDYTLKSLGGGRYKLDATRSKDGEVIERFSREGTLKELQEQHPFLKSTFGIQMLDGNYPPRGKVRALGLPPDGPAGWTVWPAAPDVPTHPSGLSVQAPPEALRFHLELPEGAGLIVERVAPGSRAEKLGLRRFDVLLRLDGELIDSPLQLDKLDGSKGELEIIRRSEARRIDLATTR